MQRAPISAFLSVALLSGVATAAMAQSRPSHNSDKTVRRAEGADHSALSYQVKISATTMKAGSSSIETGADHWRARGYDLKTLIALIYDLDVRRIEFSDNAKVSARFDVSLDLPAEVDADTMQKVLVEAVQKRFNLAIAAESRAMDVYVMTAPNGVGAGMHPHSVSGVGGMKRLLAANPGDDAGQITYMGKDCSGVSSANGISVTASTISDFGRTLEPDLDRVLIDDTHLAGSYDFKIGNYSNEQELFKLLHGELGLAVTPAKRNVTVVAVRPAGVPSQEPLTKL